MTSISFAALLQNCSIILHVGLTRVQYLDVLEVNSNTNGLNLKLQIFHTYIYRSPGKFIHRFERRIFWNIIKNNQKTFLNK